MHFLQSTCIIFCTSYQYMRYCWVWNVSQRGYPSLNNMKLFVKRVCPILIRVNTICSRLLRVLCRFDGNIFGFIVYSLQLVLFHSCCHKPYIICFKYSFASGEHNRGCYDLLSCWMHHFWSSLLIHYHLFQRKWVSICIRNYYFTIVVYGGKRKTESSIEQ